MEEELEIKEQAELLQTMVLKKEFTFRFVHPTNDTDVFTQSVNLFSQNLLSVSLVFEALVDVEVRLRILQAAYLCRIPERFGDRMAELSKIARLSYRDFVYFVNTGKLIGAASGATTWDDIEPGVLLRARDAARVSMFINFREIESNAIRYNAAVDDVNNALTTFYMLMEEYFKVEVRLLPPLEKMLIKKDL